MIAAAVAALALSAPSLQVSALVAPAGGSVDVSGAGFPADVPVLVGLDGQQLATATTDATGAFTSDGVAIAAGTPPGEHRITVQAGDGSDFTSAALAVAAAGAPEVLDETFAPPSVGAIHFAVSLPASAADGRRFPVVYFLHGLPAGDGAYIAWATLLDRVLGPAASSAIIVVPQAARTDGDTDPEYLDEGVGRAWATALAVDLPRYVDAHFPTIATRAGRALIGVSAGGYGAVSLGLSHLATFSVLESWSGYFEPTDPSGRHVLDLGSAKANAAASMFTAIPQLAASFRRQPTFLGFYVGRSDALFRADNLRFHRSLVAAHVAHTFGLYPGGHHPALWSAEAPYWVGLALAHLTPSQ